jgi:hypothetical protein
MRVNRETARPNQSPTTAPENSVSKDAFLSKYKDEAFSVEELSNIKRLEKFKPSQADLNKNGQIDGRNEMTSLFHQISEGKDHFDKSETRPKFFGIIGPPTDTPSKGAEAMAALDNIAAASENPKAGENGHDPFRPEQSLKKGRFQGERINFDAQRSVVALSESQAAQYGAKKGDLAFANFSHEGQFWVAVVPKNAVKNVDLMLEHFPAPVPAAHSMLRFRLKEGHEAKLVPQVTGDTQPGLKMKDLVLSIEATGTRDFNYDLIDGAQNNFGLSYRLESLADRAKTTQKAGHRVEQLPLRLTSAQKQNILKESIRTSQQNGNGQAYNTLTKNCTNEAFHIMDRGIGNRVPPSVHLARGLTSESLPPISSFYLSIRGLLDRNRTRADLADEQLKNQSQ